MRKPRDPKNASLEVYEDGSGYSIDITGSPPSFNKSWTSSTQDIKRLHKWLWECTEYIEWRKKRAKP